jgi:hypothetical protein
MAILRGGAIGAKDYGNDRTIDLNTLDKENNGYNLYLISGDGEIYTSPTLAKKDTIHQARNSPRLQTISYQTNKLVSGYSLKENGTVVKSAENGSLRHLWHDRPWAKWRSDGAYVLESHSKPAGKS